MEQSTQAAPANPLLVGIRIPGETFRLPSQGLFYHDGELSEDAVNGEVEVYPMTAMEEIILNTPDKLMSGKAIKEVYARCIPQVKQPGKLLARDVDFLMVCLRMVTFGQFLEVLFAHDCEDAKEHKYMVDLQAMIRNTRAIDATRLNDEYTRTLPNNQVVKIKPLTYDDMVSLIQNTALNKTEQTTDEESHRLIVETLARIIVSVDDVEDHKLITEWLEQIPLGWKRDIERTAQSVTYWGTEFTSHHVCKDCGQEMEIRVSANPVDFFT